MIGPLCIALVLGSPAAAEARDYAEALEMTREASRIGNQDPPEAVPALTTALAALEDLTPKVAADEIGQDLQIEARLNLARAFQRRGDLTGAIATMDEAIRSSFGVPLEIERFSPSLEPLYRDRLQIAEMAGRARIEVVCGVPCRVYVNERESKQLTPPLYLGTYRVWIEAVDGRAPLLRTTVRLDSPNTIAKIEYQIADIPVSGPLPERELRAPATPAVDESAIRLHYIQRWLEISGMVVGAGLVVTGGVLLGLDGQCVPGTSRPDGCRRYANVPGGVTAATIGSALVVTSTVMLAVHEVKFGKYRAQQVGLNWTLKF